MDTLLDRDEVLCKMDTVLDRAEILCKMNTLLNIYPLKTKSGLYVLDNRYFPLIHLVTVSWFQLCDREIYQRRNMGFPVLAMKACGVRGGSNPSIINLSIRSE